MPAGAGNKPLLNVQSTFLTPPVDPIQVGTDSTLSLD